MFKNKVILLYLFCFITSQASAIQLSSGVKVSTLGAGLDITRELSKKSNIRFNINHLPVEASKTISSAKIDSTLSLNTMGLLVDFYPFSNNTGKWRWVPFMKHDSYITAGAYFNNNKLAFTGKTTASFTFNDKTYSPDEIGEIKGEILANQISPYIGWGLGGKNTSGWASQIEFGMIYQNKLTSTLTASGFLKASESNNDAINATLQDAEFFPVASFAVNYKF